MPPRNRNRIFEELGLLAEPAQENPYEVLGIHPVKARELLAEDPSGGTLREFANRTHRWLAQHYYEDVGRKGDRAQFERVTAADQRVKDASGAALRRWLDAPALSAQNQKQQAEQVAVMQRAVALVQQNMELGTHPDHFSQTRWSQGVLLQRRTGALLLREHVEGGVRVQPADEPQFDVRNSAADFHGFLDRHGAFGIEPGTKIAAYLDESGRASLLTSKLGFMMDITNPVAAHRDVLHEQWRDLGHWANSTNPLLIATEVSEQADRSRLKTKMTAFPSAVTGRAGTRVKAWDLDMQVAGTVEDAAYFRRARVAKPSGAAALSGGERTTATNYFGVLATTTLELVAREAGYTPLVAPGNALLLFDNGHNVPVVTDVSVIGMLGSGSQEG